jgi:hypothetical protein
MSVKQKGKKGNSNLKGQISKPQIKSKKNSHTGGSRYPGIPVDCYFKTKYNKFKITGFRFATEWLKVNSDKIPFTILSDPIYIKTG